VCRESRGHDWRLMVVLFAQAMLISDLVAGVTVGVMLIPQGMAVRLLGRVTVFWPRIDSLPH
jgi:hypothetical protein